MTTLVSVHGPFKVWDAGVSGKKYKITASVDLSNSGTYTDECIAVCDGVNQARLIAESCRIAAGQQLMENAIDRDLGILLEEIRKWRL